MLAPINTIKHYVQHPNSQVSTGGVLNVNLVLGKVAPATATTADVIQGAVIKNVYIEFWLGGDDSIGVESQFVLTIEKKRESETDPTNASMLNLMSYANKKNIFYTTQGIIPAMLDGGMSIPAFRGWIKVPRGKQRFGLDDTLIISVAAVGALCVCGFATYKEYR